MAQGGVLPSNLSANHNEMEELVFGSEYDPNIVQNLPPIRSETLVRESIVPRYFLMISAMDFNAATKKKIVVLWTARISTSLWGHTLNQVLPTLVTSLAPMCGRNSDGPHMATEPMVPMGRVIVGAAVLKSYPHMPAAPEPPTR